MTTRPLAAALQKLIHAEGELATSKLTRAQQQQLEVWGQRTGAIEVRTRGAGRVFMVRPERAASLIHALEDLAPGAGIDLSVDLHPHAQSLARSRSAKTGKRQAQDLLLCLKAAGVGARWESPERCFSMASATADTGATLLPTRPDDEWRTDGTLWLVENQALFDRLDWLPTGATGSVSYFAGELNSRMLAWLAARKRAEVVVLFPDYDANGLCNLERLTAVCAAPVELYLFPGWESALARYGNRELHQDNLRDFTAVIGRLAGRAAEQSEQLVSQMLRLGLSLEQEAVWLSRGK